MTFANVGTLGVQAGRRDDLIEILIRPKPEMAEIGCLLYEVGFNPDQPDEVHVLELWTSEDAHKASLQLESVKSAIQEAMPLLNGQMSGTQFSVVGSPLSQ